VVLKNNLQPFRSLPAFLRRAWRINQICPWFVASGYLALRSKVHQPKVRWCARAERSLESKPPRKHGPRHNVYGVGARCILSLPRLGPGARLRSASLRPKIQQQVHLANMRVNGASVECGHHAAILYSVHWPLVPNRRARESVWVQIVYGERRAHGRGRRSIRFGGPSGHPQGLAPPPLQAAPFDFFLRLVSVRPRFNQK
jgi:hypothetical protein